MNQHRYLTKRQRTRLAAELRRLAADLDGPLTRAAYDRWRTSDPAGAGMPSSRALVESFGSWQQTTKASGVDLARARRERCLEAIRAIADERGLTPADWLSCVEYDRLREPGAPASTTIINTFNGWGPAARAAGLRPTRGGRTHYRLSDRDMVVAINRCATALGHLPSSSAYKAWRARGNPGSPSASRICERFGSWPIPPERQGQPGTLTA